MHGVEVLAALVAERLADLRRVGERLEEPLVLDVEDLEDACRALVRDLLVDELWVGVEPLVEPRDVPRAALLVADRVEPQLPLRHAEPPEQLCIELDHLGVDRRIRRADRLERKLPVLAIAPAAGPRVAVHRSDRVGLDRLRLLREPMFDVRARDRRRPFRSQRERTLAAVLEGVHLLVDDVGRLSRRALEQRRVLEPGRRDARPAVLRALLLDRADDAPPQMVARQDVVRPARRLELRHAPASPMASPVFGPGAGGFAAGASSHGAKFREERVARELDAESRLGAVPRMDDGLGRQAFGKHSDGGEQRVPVGAGKVDAADGSREEQVAAEELAAGVEGDVGRRVAGHSEAFEGDARDFERLATAEQVLGRVRPSRHADRCELREAL